MSRQPTMKNKLAAALILGGGIPHEHAKLMTDDQIISLFQFDHYPIRWADGGPTVGHNLVPRFIAAHSFKTNVDNGTGRSDQTDRARSRKITAKQEEFRARLLAKGSPELRAALDRIARHVWPKGRKIQSRGFRRKKP